ncbi:MAG: hypothetical protein K6E73_01835 [Bacteroidales bacterium]|nr:hypothetical protein [Bacteroidales bacterium]
MGSEVNASDNAKTKIKSEAYDNDGNGKKANVRVIEAAAGNDPWTVSQTLTGLPAGNYLLKVQGVSSQADRAYLYVETSRGDVYVDDEAFAANSAKISDANRYTDAYELFSTDDGTYTRTMQVSVYEDGTLTIGVKGDGNPAAAAYTYFDNFELYCLDCDKKDFQPNISSYWEEVTSVHDAIRNPENYFFSIWSDKNSCFVMRNGVGGEHGQGAEFKTMSPLYGIDPIDDLSYMWELYAFTIEGGLYNYVLISPTEREHMLQEQTGTGYFRFKADGTTAIDESLAALQLTNPVDNKWAWNFTTKSGNRLSSGYYDIWANTSNDARHAPRLKLYAIPRSYYVSDMPQALYNASELTPYDFTLMLGNPDAAGTNDSYRIGSQNNRIGWVSSNATVKTKTDGSLNGVSLFEYASGESGSFLQTIYNLPKGRYELSVSCKNAPSNAYLYISNGTTEWTAPLNDATTKSVIGELTDDDIELIVGITSDGAVSTPFQFDDFKLTYWGVGNGSDVGLADGIDYYIRYNAGTDEDPVYYYLTAGGNYGTEAVTGLHATPYHFESMGNSYRLQSVVANNDGTNLEQSYLGYVVDGYYNDYNNTSDFIFAPRDVSDLSRGYRIKDNSTADYIIHHGLNEAITGHESEFSIWQVVSKAQLFLEMSDASPYVPVDATFLVDDQGFSRNNRMKSSWDIVCNGTTQQLVGGTEMTAGSNIKILNSGGSGSGDNCDHNVRVIHNNNNNDPECAIQQTLTDIPNGFYRVSGVGAVSSTNANVFLFANNGSAEVCAEKFAVNSKNIASNKTNLEVANFFSENAGTYKKSLDIEVVDGTLTIGVRSIVKGYTFFFDNIELYYLGTQSPTANYNTQPVNFEPEGIDTDWIEVTTSSSDILAHPENYLFSIWQAPNKCFALADGTDGKQGSSYKTMSVVECSEPMASAATLWEFYKEDDKYVIVPAADREHMLQTEGSANYFRYATNTPLSTDLAAVTFVPADYDNWLVSTKQGYLHKWDAAADVVADATEGYHKIYAIRRAEYVVDYQDIQNVANAFVSVDASLMIANPNAVGTSNAKSGVMGWTSSTAANLWTVEGASLATMDGKSCFVMSKSGNNTFSQTLSGLCAGSYEFSFGTTADFASGAELFVTAGSAEYTVSLNDIRYHDHTNHITLSFTLTEASNDITVGLRTSGYAGASNILFDDFRLIYKGIPMDMSSNVVESGKSYYISGNAGSDSRPDYLYLTIGGFQGVQSLMGEHAVPYEISEGSESGTYKLRSVSQGYFTYTKSSYYNELTTPQDFRLEPVDADDISKGYYIYDVAHDWYVNPGRGEGRPLTTGKITKKPWYFYTKEQLVNGLADATWGASKDATFMIADPNFSRLNRFKQTWKVNFNGAVLNLNNNGNKSLWKNNIRVSNTGAISGNNTIRTNHTVCVNQTDANAGANLNLYQPLTGLPSGRYRLSARGFASVADRYYLYASDATGDLATAPLVYDSGCDAILAESYTDGCTHGADSLYGNNADKYALSIDFWVTGDAFTIGVKSSAAGAGCVIDDFELYYLGTETEETANFDPLDFTPSGINENWMEVSSASDDAFQNPQNYLFSIWESAKSCVGLGMADASNKAPMYVQDCGDPVLNDSLLWEFYQMQGGKFVIVPAVDREHYVQQVESTTSDYLRYTSGETNSGARAKVNFIEAGLYNNWKIQFNSRTKYLQKKTADREMIAGSAVTYHKIYAIRRSDYVAEGKSRMKYTASIVKSEDVSLMMCNPEALCYTESVNNGVPSVWNQSTQEKVKTNEGTSANFSPISGKRYFTFTAGTYTFSQPISAPTRGNYKFSVAADASAPSNALLYVTIGQKTISAAMNEIDDENRVSIPFSVAEGIGLIEVGVNVKGATAAFKLDDFRLEYVGSDGDESLDIVADEEYYLRVNLGTSTNPDYRYLSEGQSNARQAITRAHGLPFTTVALDTTSERTGFIGMQTYVLQTVIGGGTSGTNLNAVRYLGNGTGSGTTNSPLVKTANTFYLDRTDIQRNTFVFVPVADKPNNYYIYATDLGKYVVPAYFTLTEYEGETHRMEMSDTPEAWEIVSRTALINELDNANPFRGIDATVFLADNEIYSCYRGDLCKWNITCEGSTKPMDAIATEIKLPSAENIKVIVKRNYAGGDKKWSFVNVSQATAEYKIWQTLTGLPAGTYELAVRAMSSQENASYLYADNGTEVKQSVITQSIHATEVNEALDKKYFYEYNDATVNTADFKTTVRFKVGDDGTATIGIRGGTVSGDVTNFDRFELTYLGSIEVLDSYNDVPVKFEPNASESWIEISSLDDEPLQNPGDYLFSIWRSPVEVAGLAEGSDGRQGTGFMTMSAIETTEPMSSTNTLWEFYKNGDNYMLVSAAQREQALQIGRIAGNADSYRYFRYASDGSTVTSYDSASVVFGMAKYANWTIKSNKSGKYLHRCDENHADYVADDARGYFKIYAIPRVTYYKEAQNVVYKASIMIPVDLPLMIVNAEGFGELDNAPLSWGSSGTGIHVKKNTGADFADKNGDFWFEYNSDKKPTAKTGVMTQTLKNMMKGYYLFELTTNISTSGATIRIKAGEKEMTEDLKNSDLQSRTVAVPIELAEDGDITIGVDLSGCATTIDEETGQASATKYVIRFDKLNLKFLGTSETLTESIGEGEYFIRANMGTDEKPDYYYLNAGGYKWGTDPILDEHGYVFTLKQQTEFSVLNAAKVFNDGNAYYSMHTELNQFDGNHGPYFDGVQLDRNSGNSVMRFEPVDPVNRPLAYYIYTARPNSDNAYTVEGVQVTGNTVGYMTYVYNGKTLVNNSGNSEMSSGNNGMALRTDTAHATVWEVVSVNQRLKELQDATSENPMDATFFIKDASFSRNNMNTDYWTVGVDNDSLPFIIGRDPAYDCFIGTDGKLVDYTIKLNGTDEDVPRDYEFVSRNLGVVYNNNPNNTTKGIQLHVGNDGGHSTMYSGSANIYNFNVKLSGQQNTATPYDIHQKVALSNLPAGHYRLSVNGYSYVTQEADTAAIYVKTTEGETVVKLDTLKSRPKQDDQRLAAYLFTKTTESQYMAAKQVFGIGSTYPVGTADSLLALDKGYRTDRYKKYIDFDLSDDNLTIGIRGQLKSGEYVIFDNFELFYMGESYEDVADVTDANGDAYYLYNIDAGMFLGKEDNGGSNVFVKQYGDRFYFKKVDGKENTFHIYSYAASDKNKTKKLYLGPTTNSETHRVAYLYNTNEEPHEWTFTRLGTDEDGNNIYTVTDSVTISGKTYPRILEWSADSYGMVFAGLENDLEPRGTRWVFYPDSHYDRNRMFITLAQETRSELWPVMRSARVNLRKEGHYAIDNLQTTYNELDALWASTMASNTALRSKGEGLKQLMIDAMKTKGSVHSPIDVTFYMKESGLGSDDGWNVDGIIQRTTHHGRAYCVDTIVGVALVGRYDREVPENADWSFSQTMSDLPAGRYKFSAHVGQFKNNKSDSTATHYLTLTCGERTAKEDDAVAKSAGKVSESSCLELKDGEDLTVSLSGEAGKSGSLAFDNFSLLYCGSVDGKMTWNSDSTEMTLVGDWDDEEDLLNAVYDSVKSKEHILGTIFINKDDAYFSDNDKVKVNGVNWTDGNNVLIYTDYVNSIIEGDTNIVRVTDAGNACEKLILTDKMPLHVPDAFTAEKAIYKRATTLYDGWAWGSIVMPFALSKLPENVNKFYDVDSLNLKDYVYGNLSILERPDGTLKANTPVMYAACGDLKIAEDNVEVRPTSELASPDPENDNLSLYGSYVKKYYVGDPVTYASNASYYSSSAAAAEEASMLKNADGLCARDCYYLKQNKFYRGNGYFSITPFKAFIYRGAEKFYENDEVIEADAAAARPSMLEIVVFEYYNAAEMIEAEQNEITGIYDAQGIRHSGVQHGVNVIRYKDGSSKSIFVK